MDLLRQLNETTTQLGAAHAVLLENCELAATAAEVTTHELVESAVNWLGQVAQDVQSGSLTQADPSNTAAMYDQAVKMKDTAEVMGAIIALSDPDQTAGMNVSPKAARALLKTVGSNGPMADKVLGWMKEKGRSDASGFAKQAMELLKSGDSEAIIGKINELQNKVKKTVQLSSEQPEENYPAMEGTLGLLDKMREIPKI